MASTVDTNASNSNTLYTELQENLDVTIPTIDTSGIDTDVTMPTVDFSGIDTDITLPSSDLNLTGDVSEVTIEELTTKTVDGSGAFDQLMTAVNTHLVREYNAGRITGSDYSTAYISGLTSVMQQATQFVLNKNQSYWQGLLIKAQALQVQSQLALAKLQIAQTKVEIISAQATAINQIAQLKLQVAQSKLQLQTTIIQATKLQVDAYTAKAQFAVAKMSLGSSYVQIQLTEQQVISYQRDVEQKLIKNILDTWITRKTIDDGVEVPTEIDTDVINTIITKALSNASLT